MYTIFDYVKDNMKLLKGYMTFLVSVVIAEGIKRKYSKNSL